MKNNKAKTRQQAEQDVKREYDLREKKGVRGKYYRAYRRGHTVRVHQDDGSMTESHFTLEDGAVMLEPDVRRYFPDSESVNSALRSLIALVPSKKTHKAQADKS